MASEDLRLTDEVVTVDEEFSFKSKSMDDELEKSYTDGEVGDDNLIVEDIQVAGETNADRIIRIINKIKDKRNRANYSSIFDKVHQENPNINMATTKQIIHNLIQQNIIVDISRSDNEESFKMVEVKNITHFNNNKNKTNTLETNIKNTINKSTVNKINSIKDSDKNKINDLNANKTVYNNDYIVIILMINFTMFYKT